MVWKESSPSVFARMSSTFLSSDAGALERGAGRELDVDAEDSLVLVRDEPGRQHAGEEAGPDRHRGDDRDREQRPAHEQARDAHVARRA